MANKVNTATVTNVDLPTEEKEVELATPISVTPVEVKEKLYEVNITKDFRVYLGDRWWDFKKGKDTVPFHIKQYLMEVNALSAI